MLLKTTLTPYSAQRRKSMATNTITNSVKSGVLGRILFVVLLLFLLIGPLFGPVPTFLSSRMALEPSLLWLLVGFVISFSLIIIVALKLDGEGLAEIGHWLRDLGLGKPTPWPAAVVGAIVGLALGALSLMAFLQFNPGANVLEISLFRVLTALIAALGAVQEDILTRGYLMNRLNQISVPNWAQALLSALVMAGYHAIWTLNIGSFIATVILGLILSGFFLWGKRSLTPVILAHALVSLLAEPFNTLLIFSIPGP
jgi:membrane protease YdiL (CAAX protease family)